MATSQDSYLSNSYHSTARAYMTRSQHCRLNYSADMLLIAWYSSWVSWFLRRVNRCVSWVIWRKQRPDLASFFLCDSASPGPVVCCSPRPSKLLTNVLFTKVQHFLFPKRSYLKRFSQMERNIQEQTLKRINSERKFSSTLHDPFTPRPGNPSWSKHRFSRLIANNFWLGAFQKKKRVPFCSPAFAEQKGTLLVPAHPAPTPPQWT
jgi:hypothetical protein